MSRKNKVPKRRYTIQFPDGSHVDFFWATESEAIRGFMQAYGEPGERWKDLLQKGYKCIPIYVRKLSLDERLRRARLERINPVNQINHHGSKNLPR